MTIRQRGRKFVLPNLKMKKCIACKVEKSETEFHLAPRNTDGLTGQCKVCRRLKGTLYWHALSIEEKRAKDKKEKDRTKASPELQDRRKKVVRRHRLKKLYGFTEEAYLEKLVSQNNQCEICKLPFEGAAIPYIDHCHATGKVRGILCQTCNQALGLFRDLETLLGGAIAYLKKYK